MYLPLTVTLLKARTGLTTHFYPNFCLPFAVVAGGSNGTHPRKGCKVKSKVMSLPYPPGAEQPGQTLATSSSQGVPRPGCHVGKRVGMSGMKLVPFMPSTELLSCSVRSQEPGSCRAPAWCPHHNPGYNASQRGAQLLTFPPASLKGNPSEALSSQATHHRCERDFNSLGWASMEIFKIALILLLKMYFPKEIQINVNLYFNSSSLGCDRLWHLLASGGFLAQMSSIAVMGTLAPLPVWGISTACPCLERCVNVCHRDILSH